MMSAPDGYPGTDSAGTDSAGTAPRPTPETAPPTSPGAGGALPDAVRTLHLPDGRTLVVRPASGEDTDRFVELYESLSDRDRYQRFFSGKHPRRRVLNSWARIGEGRGFGLVVELRPAGEDSSGPDGRHRIVAEAAYKLVPDGTGNFAMVVAPDWRGWLGPYLLKVLLTEAAARGVPQLSAEILATNRGMLSLIERHPHRVVARDGTVVTVAVETGLRSRPPTP